MADEFDDNKVEGTEEPEVETEPEKPELPPEPVDRNEVIDVQLTRKEKRNNRIKEFEERTARAERAAEEARREAQEARALHQQRLAHPQDQSQQTNPTARRLQEIDEATDRLHREYEAVASRPGFTKEEQQKYEVMARQLQTARISAIAQASAPQINEQEIYRRVAWQQFTSEHSDVFSNPKSQSWAIARWQQLVQGEGMADTKDLAEKILDETRVKFGMKPRRGGGSQPDAATRARLSGISAAGGGGDTDTGGAVRMGKRERQMAEALYDNLPPREAWQKWANGPGKRAAMKQASRK